VPLIIYFCMIITTCSFIILAAEIKRKSAFIHVCRRGLMTESLGLPKNDMGADNSIEQACAPDSKQMRLLGYSIADMAGHPVGIRLVLWSARPKIAYAPHERTNRARYLPTHGRFVRLYVCPSARLLRCVHCGPKRWRQTDGCYGKPIADFRIRTQI